MRRRSSNSRYESAPFDFDLLSATARLVHVGGRDSPRRTRQAKGDEMELARAEAVGLPLAFRTATSDP